MCKLKNPTVISIWLLVGFDLATWSVHSTSDDNTLKRVWQYIEKEKRKCVCAEKPCTVQKQKVAVDLVGHMECEIFFFP